MLSQPGHPPGGLCRGPLRACLESCPVRPAQRGLRGLPARQLCACLDATFNRIHGIAVRFAQRLPPKPHSHDLPALSTIDNVLHSVK